MRSRCGPAAWLLLAACGSSSPGGPSGTGGAAGQGGGDGATAGQGPVAVAVSTSVGATTGAAGTSSSTSTGSGGGETTWTAVDWAAPLCALEVADEPALAFPPIEWEPCPSGREGCERVKRTWTQKSDTSHSITKIRRIGDGYELGWSITFADDDARQLVIGTDGVTRVAYRRRSPSVECQHVLLQHGGDEGHWFGVQTLETAIYVHQADGASSATTVLPFEVGSEDWEGNQRFYAIRSDAGVVLYDRTTALLSAVPPGNFTSTPFLANEVVFMLRGVGNARVLWAFDPQNRSFAEILAPPPGRQIAEAESDGERLVWTTRREEDSGTFVDAVLFAAPLATTAEALEPIEIRALPSANFGRAAAGAGHFAILSGDYDALVIDVVRLDDGRLWEVPVTLEDDEFRQIVWVDETYLFYNSDKYLHRQSIADLGPGEP